MLSSESLEARKQAGRSASVRRKTVPCTANADKAILP